MGNTEEGVGFKEVKRSRGSDLDLILNRNIFSNTQLSLRNSVSNEKHKKVMCDKLLFSSPILHVKTTLNGLITAAHYY